MSIKRDLWWRIILMLVLALLSVVVRTALAASGIFNPIGNAFGGWLRLHVSPAQAEWTSAIIISIALYVGSLFLISWLIVWWNRPDTDRKTPAAMRFVFPNTAANLDSKVTLFRESFRLFPDGQPIKVHLTLQIFYIGVENLTDKTIRNVRLVIESVTIPPRPADLHCRAKRTGEVTIDIQPKATELFLIGEGYDSSDGAGVIIRQGSEIERLAEFAAVAPFYLGSHFGGPHPLLKNDGYRIGFSAYADDVPSISAEAILNTKERIELRLLEGPDVSAIS